ncbi:MAG: nickel-dependent lactate racemase, partial [bacterium]|nr:nickel-dependent lactate racemase [bacterium]
MNLPYGTSHLEFPDKWDGKARLVEPGPFPGRIDSTAEVIRALENPVGCPRLADVARKGQKVALVVPDLTRRAGVSVYLPPLLDELARSGVRDDDVTIIVALGIHRPLDEDELGQLAGKDIRGRYNVVNHEADKHGSNLHMGNTVRGLPVELNRTVAEADRVVLTGSVTYHYFAGYGGGRKSLLPGVASRKSCEAHHRMVVDYRRGKLQGELGPGILEGNPVHGAMLEACLMAPPIFILNTVTEPGGSIIGAAAGELIQAHLDACRRHDIFYRKEIKEPSRLVIASAGGHPRDVNFVQAHKGLYSAHRTVAADGVVILAARCPEGTGNPDFIRWFERCRTEEQWLDELERRYQINGQTAFSTWLRVKAVPTVLISELPPDLVKIMGMIPAGDPVEALQRAGEIL